MDQQSPLAASVPQIRSRITVVCAECKRLKLKCDRRSPCSSCTKRDTVARCIYSPAAAEKVDLHSLNNRLMQVEATLAQLTSGTFQSSYPPAQPQNATGSHTPTLVSPATSQSSHHTSASHQHHHHPAAIMTPERGSSCSLALSLDEIRSAWLDAAGSGRCNRPTPGRSVPPTKSDISSSKMECQPRLPRNMNPSFYPHSRHSNPQPLLPSISLYYSTPSPPPFGSPPHTPFLSITPAILDLLPTTPTCMRILARAKTIFDLRPVPLFGGWGRFQRNVISMLNDRPGVNYATGPGDSSYPGNGANKSEHLSSDSGEKQRSGSLPFFSIACAVLAVGASVSAPELLGGENINAGFLYALSQQALSIWETSSSQKCERDYILYLVACLVGANYLLIVTSDTSEDSKEMEGRNEAVGKARAVFPLVGKMVNVARVIDLGKERAAWQEEESECTSKGQSEGRIWEEFRRTVWWDVMFYDLFVSDALGHPSLISPLSYSPKFPEMSDMSYDPHSKRYVAARCRLVHLAQRVRHKLSHPGCCCGYTFDQATALEDDVRRWSRESLLLDDDERCDERRHIWELSIVAQLLILRAYIPFLISANSAASAKKQANVASVPNKGRSALDEKSPIQGSVLAMATQSCLGAAQTILRLGTKLKTSISKESNGGSTLVGPILMDIYSLERMVFDAVVITQSSTAVSVVSEAEVRRGFDILAEREFTLGQERREIWETVQQRVFASGKLQFPPAGSGTKRKHDQLESPIATIDKTSIRKVEGAASKHPKISKQQPVVGIRYRPGKMLVTPPIRTAEPEYERFKVTEYSYIPDIDVRGAGNEQFHQHSLSPQQSKHHVGTYSDPPAVLSPQQHVTQVEHRTPVDSPMAQTKPMYHFDEAQASATSFNDYARNHAVNGDAQTDHPSPASYRSNVSPFNSHRFGSPESFSKHTPNSQVAADSPTIGFDISDGQTAAKYPVGGPPKFGSDRQSFAPDNPQPHYDKISPFPNPGAEVIRSPVLNSSASSVEGHSHRSSPARYEVPAPDSGHSSAGFISVGSYEPLGVRMEGSVSGTPIYERSLYDKVQQHQILQHGSHALSVNSHPPHNVITNSFIGELAQGFSMPTHHRHASHQSWTSTQPPQPLVDATASQNFW
ncbi:hypothetical protein AGABI2DRAFT_121240 [Agaricus bisporus var. bisporus H97]|uniref:hypothetical protein n=1 Tax=Agaricus bisporus var. bisporus (strain H97 / ATCC MYA-4626 / FGSC 10389) TaxID=936046 RepID=UPI00029F72A8|nr:hypothetical protein AGABI2DRAFT_121240 [Agaricus bisporus var. bisporus H97]EKV44293.1 hypothetical protein AGABI2DRAFT_121240 [Agaricus bisporus var. bisporus H97]